MGWAPYGGFLKWWYPTTMGFPTRNDHFGVFWGYHHLRKHPYMFTYMIHLYISSLKLTFMHLKIGGWKMKWPIFRGVMWISGRVIGIYVFIDRTHATRVQWRTKMVSLSKVIRFWCSSFHFAVCIQTSLSRWWFQRCLELLPKKLLEMIRFQFDKTTTFLFGSWVAKRQGHPKRSIY